MKQYDLTLIYNYIAGEDLGSQEVERLENDPDFMMCVINATGDKKLYSLCSSEVKGNLNFAKFLIRKFHDDENFIIMVAYNALDGWYRKNQDDVIELRILLNRYVRNIKDGLPMISRSLLESFYLRKRNLYDECIANSNKPDAKELYGMGYLIVQSDYGDSELIQDFFAKRMLGDIFKLREGTNLEELIHSRFKSSADVSKYGVVKYLLDYVRQFDPYLCEYLIFHIDLLSDFEEQVIWYADPERWQKYEEEQEEIRIKAVLDEVLKFFMNYYDGIDIYEELLEYVADEFDIVEQFMKYDFYFKYYIENKDNDIEFTHCGKLREEELPFYTMRQLMELKKRLRNILKGNKKANDLDEEKNDGKIIKLEINKKKHRH